MKADNSPLTRADQEANAVICQGLVALGMFWINVLCACV
jgi:3'-phosphoadenosine 5'-phosphosulfate (PAPS) 3'-phosphatase